jgi:hypothetical protein
MLMRVPRLGPGMGLAFAVALTATVAVTASSAAHAGPVQFASFTTASGTPFSFTNNGGNATTTSSFASTSGLAGTGGGGSIFDQPIDGATTDAITFTDTTSHQTLLSVTHTGDVTGEISTSSTSPSSSANTHVLTYSSPLLPSFFSLPSNFQISLPVDLPDPRADQHAAPQSFTSPSASGQLLINPALIVSAPASAVMFGTGLAAVALLAVRTNRRRKVVPAAV